MHHSENARIHVALSPWDLTDDYNRHAGVTLLSLLEHSSLPVTAHLLYDANLSKGKEAEEAYNKSCYQKIADRYGCELHFHHVEVPKWTKNLESVKKWTQGTLLRLYLPELLPNVEKIIYVDCDMAIQTEIDVMWNIPLDGKYLAAVPDSDVPKFNQKRRELCKEKMIDVESYFCAGTLIFNLKKLQELEKPFTEIMFSYLQENPELPFLDQDMLNWFCKGDYVQLDDKYNVYTWREEVLNMANDCIIHYAGSKKPWKKYNGEIDNYYWKYLMQTPWCEKPEDLFRYIRDAPDVTKAILLLQKNFFANIGGSRKEKVSTAAKFTISIWKDFLSGFLNILKNR